MKIAHVLLTSRFAGSERYMIELANQQSVHHEVTVVMHESAAQARPDALAHRLDPQVKKEFVSGHWLLAQWQVRRKLRKLRVHVIHAHLSAACRSIQAMNTDALRIATLHIHYKPQQHDRLDALIAIAPWQIEAIPAPLQKHTCQIDNWTNLGNFNETARQRIRKELGVEPNEYLIGALGRAEFSKGFDVLIRAFASAPRPGVRLAIIGGGRDLTLLRGLPASKHVLMPGFVEHPQEYLAAFDAFVSPSRSEPFGLALLEAMAQGLPILATASQGACHLSGLIGRPLVACDNDLELSLALGRLLVERPSRRHYDLSGHQLATQVELIEAWYRQCLNARPTGAKDTIP